MCTDRMEKIPVSEKASHVARRDAPAKEKENTGERANEKVRGRVQAHVFCVRDLIGLVTVLQFKSC